jgi:hypothetical protein
MQHLIKKQGKTTTTLEQLTKPLEQLINLLESNKMTPLRLTIKIILTI